MYTIAAYIMCSVCVLQITDDLRVVATTREQRQKIRAHELLERKEMLAQVNNNIIISLSITSHTLTLTLSHSHTLTHTLDLSHTSRLLKLFSCRNWSTGKKSVFRGWCDRFTSPNATESRRLNRRTGRNSGQ